MKDLSLITACGESCEACKKLLSGACPGCIAADGYVPEWSESGRCRIHACAKAHGASACFLCASFPCPRIPELIPWKEDPVTELTRLREACRGEAGGPIGGSK